MSGWAISTILVTLVAIGLVIRLLIEDEKSHKMQLRIDGLNRDLYVAGNDIRQLEKEIEYMREEKT